MNKAFFNAEKRMEVLEKKIDDLNLHVVEIKDTLHGGFETLSKALITVATTAISRTDKFSGKDVLLLLAGIAAFIIIILHGLDSWGLLEKVYDIRKG
jgi:hypothetical protein